MVTTSPLDGMTAAQILNAAGISQANQRIIVMTATNSGAALTAGLLGILQSPVAGTITNVALFSDAPGGAVVDIWKSTFASAPPSSGNSITASSQPTLSSSQKYTDSTLAGWTTAINQGDVLAFNLNSASTIKTLTVQLTVQTS